MNLRVHYYRNYPIDYDADMPAQSQLGWEQGVESLPRDSVALLVMHAWNLTLDEELPWPPTDAATALQMQHTEWAKRYRQDVQQMAEVLQASRQHGLKICHVAALERYASAYSAYTQLAAETEPEPEPQPGALHGDSWHQAWYERIYGPNTWEQMSAVHGRFDFAPGLCPAADESVVVTSRQLNHWARKHGVSNLIYIGFAINMCLWFSPCGMADMSRLLYRCMCVEEACTSVEFRESAPQLLNKQSAMWRVGTQFGYVLKQAEFLQDIAEHSEHLKDAS